MIEPRLRWPLALPCGACHSKMMDRSFHPSPDRHAPVVLWIVALCALPEAAFTLLETPLFGAFDLRRQALVHGAFWPGLLHGWEAVYPGQPSAMFLSHAFLHGGFLHMLFNMLIMVHLSRDAVLRLGQKGFLLLYLVTAVGGGAGFALLSSAQGPMVGASGAVFGLFGALQFWDLQRRRRTGESLSPVLRTAIGLILMNIILWILTGGYLAWEAHLGGYIAGFLFAAVVTPTLNHRFRGFG